MYNRIIIFKEYFGKEMHRGLKKPLYRQVNTKARGVHHDHGGHDRNSKSSGSSKMSKGVKRGLDYTPLFRFLISHVGDNWTDVKREAVSRLDNSDPINWMVFPSKEVGEDVVRVGESNYYSGLYVDKNNILQRVDPQMSVEKLEPSCGCCTHSFNGVQFVKKFKG